MSHISNIEKLLNPKQNPTALLTATFFFSGAHGGIFSLALPFVVTLLGGSEKDVGLCYGLGTIGYVISCMTAAKHLDRFSPKRTLQVSSAIIAISVFTIFAICKMHTAGKLPVSPIIAIAIVNILIGLVLALFWPPMMGWLSTGHEGPALSKRLGMFNLSWSLALVVAPLVAGFIIEIDPILAVLASGISLSVAFLAVSIAPTPIKLNSSDTSPDQQITIEPAHPLNEVFSLMSRLALLTACLAVSLFRTQFALFFTEHLGFSKFQFGIATTIYCLASFASFYVTGKTKAWHHKITPFIAAQLMSATSMLIILYTRNLITLYTAAILLGVGQSFVYSSHQFYCVSGKTNRSGSMAIHELLIAAGYASGALAGGYLAEYLTSYWPYGFGLTTIITAITIQTIMFKLHKTSSP